MTCGFYSGFIFADYAIWLDKHGWFEQSTAYVTLVSSGFFATTMGAFSFDETVRQKPLVMLTIKHLSFLLKDIAIILYFQKCFLNKLFVDRTLSTCVIVKASVPTAEKLSDTSMVAVSEFFGSDFLFYSFDFNGRAMCVGTAHHHCIVSF
jgi:hypothetical protein